MGLIKSKDQYGLHELVYDDKPNAKNRYKLDGEPVPGVSTFLKAGMPTSEGLVNWKIIKAVEFVLDSLTFRNLEGNRATKSMQILKNREGAFIQAAKTAYKADSDEAAGIGNIVHEYAHLTSLGENEEALEVLAAHEGSPQWQQILNAVSKVDQFHEQHRGEVVLAEALVASPTYKFGGRFDVLVKDGNDLVMRDYKTSKRFYIDQFMQAATYSLAVKEWYGYDVTALEIVRFSKKAEDSDADVDVLRIDDRDVIKRLTDVSLMALNIFNFNKEFSKDKRFK